MDPDYWLERWEKQQIGFHEGAPNAWLEEHALLLGPGPGRRVLVPLCGKSVDLAFLAAHGFEVVGVELARSAAEAFFEEAGLEPTRRADGELERFSVPGIEIVVGDYLTLGPEQIGTFDAYYDRAAVVAMPPELRKRYARAGRALLRPEAVGLIVTFEHDGPKDAPPFSVDAAELARLWPSFEWLPLGTTDLLEARSVLRERGATFAREHAYAVRPRRGDLPS